MIGFATRFFAALVFALITTVSWAACPVVSNFQDGCSGAPSANADTIQVPNFFSSVARQNGQPYASTGACAKPYCHPPWNVAGVDYPVGVNAAYAGNLKDPSKAPLPQGCAFHGGAQPYVQCGLYTTKPLINNLTISGYDFGNTSVGPVQLYIAGGVTGTLTISNNKFFNGPAVDSEIVAVDITDQNSANVVMDYNYFNGDGAALGAKSVSGGMVSDQATGSLTYQYNAMVNMPSRALGYETDSSVNISYNYGAGLNFGSPVHSEFTTGGPPSVTDTTSSVKVAFNTFLVDNNNDGATADIYLSNGIGGNITTTNVDNNVVVSNEHGSLTTASYLIEAGHNHYGVINYLDNYFDPNGSYGCIAPDGISGMTVTTETFIGNVDMIDGSTVHAGSCDFSDGVLPTGSKVGTGEPVVIPVDPIGGNQEPRVLPIEPVGGKVELVALYLDPIGGGGESGVPEPSTWAMVLIGCVALGYSMARRARNARLSAL